MTTTNPLADPAVAGGLGRYCVNVTFALDARSDAYAYELVGLLIDGLRDDIDGLRQIDATQGPQGEILASLREMTIVPRA